MMAAKRRAGSTASRISSRATNKVSTSTSLTRSTPPAQAQPNDDAFDSDPTSTPPPTKKRKTGAAAKQEASRVYQRLFSHDTRGEDSERTCSLPKRRHPITYHRPLLLHRPTGEGKEAQKSLLSWFDSVSTARSMPWRQAWIDPSEVSDADELRTMLEKRAYQVWISEIMLQQTRVAVVIDYWNRWMEKWPTIRDLAAADPDDVLAAWKGLGYYSRATRIHQAAKHVVRHPKLKGLLPEDAKSLEAEVPGVGRYTAGAISSIVFGRPEPMVDGNVLRVLSRQLGLLGNVKADKAVIDVLWAAADNLVKDVAMGDEHYGGGPGELPRNDRPGRWGQGLMELGSTVCTPKPNCSVCPITSTCRAYQEGMANASPTAKSAPMIGDIEDSCTLCEPFESVMGEEEAVGGAETNTAASKLASAKPQKKQATLSSFAFTRQSNGNGKPSPKPSEVRERPQIESIVNHARKFPLKVAKKAVREEETLVCAIRHGNNSYLIHRRPEKGLLAGLWELPSHALQENEASSLTQRGDAAKDFVYGLFSDSSSDDFRYLGELGSVPWLFSHLKLTMHVHVFELLPGSVDTPSGGGQRQPGRWTRNAGEESMGTGMQKCWSLVQEDAAVRYG